MTNRLQAILEAKEAEVEAVRASIPQRELEDRIEDAPPVRGFLRELEKAEDVALIAEVKAASPSQGSIRPNLNPVEVAQAYESAGAHAMSVLTDGPHFGGSAENLIVARQATSLPVLRKDFLLKPYQIFESRVMGADAVLLIAAALEDDRLRMLYELARCHGMDVLVEVHDEPEAERAGALGFPLIGINNRDLATFEIDLATTERVRPVLSASVFVVSESGLSTRADIDRVKAVGARGVLIGTTFCAAENVGAKVREVMAWT